MPDSIRMLRSLLPFLPHEEATLREMLADPSRVHSAPFVGDSFPAVARPVPEIVYLDRAQAVADTAALAALALAACPADIRDFGTRHNIPHFAELLWRDAFMAGWRQALAAYPPNPPVP